MRELIAEAREASAKDLSKEQIQAVIYHYKASPEFLGIKGETVAEVVKDLRPDVLAGWMERNLKIKTKQSTVIPFMVNIIQWRFLAAFCEECRRTLKVRINVLKARQFGISTEVQGLFCCLMAMFPNIGARVSAATIAHDDDATTNLRNMQRRYLEYLPTAPNVVIKNDDEITYGVPFEATMSFGCAKRKELKRSYTFQLIHKSEKAFWPWPEITDLALMQTVPKEEDVFSVVVNESTACGAAGEFYRDWKHGNGYEGKGLNGYKNLFYGWHEFPAYTITDYTKAQAREVLETLTEEERDLKERVDLSVGQLIWRRQVLADDCGASEPRFKQEYPAYPRQAFQTSGRPFFDQKIIQTRIESVEDLENMFRGTLMIAEGVQQ